MGKKVYRTAMGKVVDLGSLQLKNETVRAVGNMGVNARGDRLDSQNNTIESRSHHVGKQYKKQTKNVSESPVVASKKNSNAVAKEKTEKKSAPVQENVAAEPEVTETAQTTPKGGLADAIAKSRQIKQEAMKTPRQLAQEKSGVTKI